MLALPPADPGLPPSTAYELTQIVREALRNAVRHGGATQATVKLGPARPHCSLVIRDNGRGFASGNGGIGADGFLHPAAAPWSIRERTAALGGTLRVRSQAGHGRRDLTSSFPAIAAADREPMRTEEDA